MNKSKKQQHKSIASEIRYLRKIGLRDDEIQFLSMQMMKRRPDMYFN